MCNLYSMNSNAEAIRQFANHMRDIVGNLPVLPGIFPDYSAPIVRNAPDGARELAGHAIVAFGADGQHQETHGQARGEGQARRF
jgi:putative SOS response-associated peptidase YedK